MSKNEIPYKIYLNENEMPKTRCPNSGTTCGPI